MTKRIIGIPKEIKPQEYRVGLTPTSVAELNSYGHDVIIEKSAGIGAGFRDAEYEALGARIIDTAEELYASSDMIVKVKEPQAQEVALLNEKHLLFAYLHLAAERSLTEGLLKSGCSAVAFETVTDRNGRLPLLAPMSEVAGRLAPQFGAQSLLKYNKGRGILMGGVPGTPPATVTVLGGGVSGRNAARVAMGMGAQVTVLDKSPACLKELDALYGPALQTRIASTESIKNYCFQSDMVIAAVLVAGDSAPKLLSKDDLNNMKPGSVLVDISIDQGGCFESSRPTTHSNPTFIINEVVHFCVANMPGAVPRTSTEALNAAILPYAVDLANNGFGALTNDANFMEGLNVHKGSVTHPAVAKALNLPLTNIKDIEF